MATPLSGLRLDQIGTPAAYNTTLKAEIDLLCEFIDSGNRLEHPGSPAAKQLSRMAEQYGSLRAPDGEVFVTTVGRRSKVSKIVAGRSNDLRVPMPYQHSHGIVIADSLAPFDLTVRRLSSSESMLWRFGSVALNVLSVNPDADIHLTTSGYRVHLGTTALRLVRTLPIEELAKLDEAVHPLSRPKD